jgi:hypothetical protein
MDSRPWSVRRNEERAVFSQSAMRRGRLWCVVRDTVLAHAQIFVRARRTLAMPRVWQGAAHVSCADDRATRHARPTAVRNHAVPSALTETSFKGHVSTAASAATTGLACNEAAMRVRSREPAWPPDGNAPGA